MLSGSQAHDAAVLRVSFAHPIHGSLLASCGHDRTVRIWEEPSASDASASGAGAGAGAAGGMNREGRWNERAVLGGAKGSVRSVEFSPPNLSFGLRVVSRRRHTHCRSTHHLSVSKRIVSVFMRTVQSTGRSLLTAVLKIESRWIWLYS